ncbi:hypothetical protein P7C70_g3640, partial [Phenoliferia sp. Uapishka_3]
MSLLGLQLHDENTKEALELSTFQPQCGNLAMLNNQDALPSSPSLIPLSFTSRRLPPALSFRGAQRTSVRDEFNGSSSRRQRTPSRDEDYFSLLKPLIELPQCSHVSTPVHFILRPNGLSAYDAPDSLLIATGTDGKISTGIQEYSSARLDSLDLAIYGGAPALLTEVYTSSFHSRLREASSIHSICTSKSVCNFCTSSMDTLSRFEHPTPLDVLPPAFATIFHPYDRNADMKSVFEVQIQERYRGRKRRTTEKSKARPPAPASPTEPPPINKRNVFRVDLPQLPHSVGHPSTTLGNSRRTFLADFGTCQLRTTRLIRTKGRAHTPTSFETKRNGESSVKRGGADEASSSARFGSWSIEGRADFDPSAKLAPPLQA